MGSVQGKVGNTNKPSHVWSKKVGLSPFELGFNSNCLWQTELRCGVTRHYKVSDGIAVIAYFFSHLLLYKSS